MLFTFKDVYYAVADKFISKSTTNKTWKRNVPESPNLLSRESSQNFFFFCNYPLGGLSQCCLYLELSTRVAEVS